MTTSDFLAGTFYGSDLEITQTLLDTTGLPRFFLGLKSAVPYSCVQ